MACRLRWTLAVLAANACASDSSLEEVSTGLGGSGVSAGGGTGGSADEGAAESDSGNEPPPEDEDEGAFEVPRASGRFVYSASASSDSVAVIDSSNLAIDVVAVGRGPTVVAPLFDATNAGSVAVLDQGSNDVALLHTGDDFTTTVVVRDVTAGANNLAVTPDGAFLFVYHDVDGASAQGPGSDQELTVLDIAADASHAMTVGAHPREIVFTSDSSTAYVVTDDGVNVIPIAQLGMLDKPDVIPVVSDPAVDPKTVEIRVAGDRAVALSRVDGEHEIVATDLGSAEQFSFVLPDIPTDLDLSTDATFALLTTPSVHGSRVYELPLPVDAGTEPIVHALPTEYVGLAQLSAAGDAIVLYTTVDPFDGDQTGGGEGTGGSGETTTGSDSGSSSESGASSTSDDGGGDTGAPMPDPDEDPRQRVTIVHRGTDGSWTDTVTLFVDDPIASVGIAPDGANAMLVHEMAALPEPGPAWSYTLVDLTKSFPVKKRQSTEVAPGAVLFTPEGDRAVVLLRNDELDVRRIDLIDLRSFIVEALVLGSPPEGAGYVDATAKLFVSQVHPTGRITFIDSSGAVETVTGYRLNDAVKD
ncbi:MAG TPA: hypothetical protein VG755_26900 [Nannocystaceae bacterium]|nr:hypothetical protein [Nannocystaceae bacterium]